MKQNFLHGFAPFLFFAVVALSSFNIPVNEIRVQQKNLTPSSLDPYTISAQKAVSARSLSEEIIKWSNGWKDKKVSLIVWTGGGISGGAIKAFSDQNRPGDIILNAEIAESELANISKFISTSQQVILQGTISKVGRTLEIRNCKITGGFEKVIPSGIKHSPFRLNSETPVNPLDIISSVNAWKGVEVTVRDKCRIPVNGNAISFPNDKAAPNKFNLQPDFVRAILSKSIKNGKSFIGIKSVKGVVYGFDDKTGEISLNNALVL